MNDFTTQPDQARDTDSRGKVDTRMKCPSCGSSDLRVSAEITCTVVQKQSPDGDPYDALEALTGSEPYWDRDTFTSCADLLPRRRGEGLRTGAFGNGGSPWP